jgi:hypothetical protein
LPNFFVEKQLSFLIPREAKMPVVIRMPSIAITLFLFTSPMAARDVGETFPNGVGKTIVIAQCGRCHELDRAIAGYTPEGWRTVIRMMLNLGMDLPQDQVDIVTEYLIKSFPGKARPSPALIPGSGEAIILQQVCDKRGVCCLGESEACFGTDSSLR